MFEQKYAVRRQLIHMRQVTCTAYSREDGLIEIQGILIDTKPFVVTLPERGYVEGNEPIHERILTVAIDRDLIIRSAFAKTQRSPYKDCSLINALYKRLTGLRIRSGFLSQGKRLFLNTDGYSHPTELLSPIATSVAPSQILPLSGSQQGFDLAAKLLIDPGSPVLTEGATCAS
jgi:hypothetical protein